MMKKNKDMKTLINKENPEIKVIVPEVTDGGRYYMVSRDYLPLGHVYDMSVYFDKNKWDLVE